MTFLVTLGVAVFTTAILAGGQARRLGGIDKSALMVGARAILERQLAIVRGLTPNTLIVGRDRVLDAMDVTVVPDLIEGAGALGGLYTALTSSPTEHVLVIACDMPFLTAPFLTHLVARLASADAAIPRDRHGRQHLLCASYARRVATYLQARIDAGDLRVGKALEGLSVTDIDPEELASLDPTGRVLFNVNTPDDYALARSSALDDQLDG